MEDHDPDKKSNVERALDLWCRVASRDGPWSCAGKVIKGTGKGKRAVGEIADGEGWGKGMVVLIVGVVEVVWWWW